MKLPKLPVDLLVGAEVGPDRLDSMFAEMSQFSWISGKPADTKPESSGIFPQIRLANVFNSKMSSINARIFLDILNSTMF